jgi:RHS repeat-associated protein
LTVLTRKGVQFGNNAAVVVDDLQYAYEDFSNKLKAVTDITSVASTATVGDFKDGNTTSNDYVYDDNGNLVVDLNNNIKNLVGANGVTYNHLDKPVEIKIEGKGTVKITYDADGAKLKREFLNSTTNANKVTWYLGEYQYEEVVGGPSPKALAVSFISFGEGRIRPITPRNESNTYDALQLDGNLTLPNGKKGSIDYFISDHRTDVRMILTEEKQWSYTTASMETASSRNTVEEGLFSTQVNLSRAPKTEVPGWTANTSQYVSKLNNTRMVGPNQMLKVMAGDLLHANVQYYYQQVATNSTGSTVFGSVLSMLGSSITGSAVTSAATKAASSSIIANLNTGLPFSQAISPDITSSAGNLPKAYLNVVFFDERFNFVSESSTSVRVGAANVAANLALTQIKAPENGYCYVYISNESTVSVYFDNLQVRHDRGRIVEENHYYAYGLRINAISSKAYGGPANNYLYQGDFAELDEDLGWTDFMLRSYDAEIGRFLQNDPYDQFTSGYVGMGGDPVNLVDENGGWSSTVTGTIIGGAVGFLTPYAIEAISGKDIENKALWGLGGAFIGSGLGYGISASIAGKGPVLLNIVAFYKGLFGGSGHVNSIYKPIGQGWTNIDVPVIWGEKLLDFSNLIRWVDASRTVVVHSLLVTVKLSQMVDQLRSVDGYPYYRKSINLQPNNGNLKVEINEGVPADYFMKYNNSSNNLIDIELNPDVFKITQDRLNTIRDYKKSGVNLEEIRKRNIQNKVSINNSLILRIYDSKTNIFKFRYLSIMGIKFKFIKKPVD